MNKTMNETKELMMSGDYRERFIAEYWQTKIRYEKLTALINKIEASQRTRYFEHNKLKEPVFDCPADILMEQQTAMGEYLHVLEVRSIIEGIDLFEEVGKEGGNNNE